MIVTGTDRAELPTWRKSRSGRRRTQSDTWRDPSTSSRV